MSDAYAKAMIERMAERKNGIRELREEITTLYEEVAKITKERDTAIGALRQLRPDKITGPFICGYSGGDEFMPERINICPQYGSDIVMMYDRRNQNNA